MSDADTVNPSTLIQATIRELLARRGVIEAVVSPESKLTSDLGLDSLELAELSAVLEDELGHDPYSQGIVPETVAGLVSYYER